MVLIGGARGRRRRAPPLSVQILSFLHTNFLRRYHVGPWRPPTDWRPPPSGNPGSATGTDICCQAKNLVCHMKE